MLPPQKYLIKIIGLTTSNSWYRLVPATPSPWLHMATTMDQDHPEQLFSGWVGRGQPTTSTYVGGSIWDEVPRHRSYLVGPVVLLVLVVVRTRPVAQSLLCIMDTWTPRTTPVPVHHIQLPWLDLMWYNPCPMAGPWQHHRINEPLSSEIKKKFVERKIRVFLSDKKHDVRPAPGPYSIWSRINPIENNFYGFCEWRTYHDWKFKRHPDLEDKFVCSFECNVVLECKHYVWICASVLLGLKLNICLNTFFISSSISDSGLYGYAYYGPYIRHTC